MKILDNILSGLFSEATGPGTWADEIHAAIVAALPQHQFDLAKKPYSVIPEGAGLFNPIHGAQEFINNAANYDLVINTGHSFGGSAAKFVGDAMYHAGLGAKLVGTFGLDAVPNTDRCGHWFNDGNRWHFPGPVSLQIYQRHSDLLPKGCMTVQDTTHVNVNVLADLGQDDDHLTLPTDPVVQEYLVRQIVAAIGARP